MAMTRDEIVKLIGADKLATLEAAGVRLVPLEPTEMMLRRALLTTREASAADYVGSAAYRAMLAASPYAPEVIE